MAIKPDNSFHALLLAADRHDLATFDELLKHLRLAPERGRRVQQRSTHYLLGRRALSAGDPAKAIADFQEALRHRPPYYGPDWFEDCLADAYLKLGRFDEAIAEYQRALSVHPRMALARYHLATAYERKRRGGLARAEYRRFSRSLEKRR